jgi:tetratricopeptide (TPR) repeat protein
VWICLLLAAAVLAVFGRTLNFEFVNYDDQEYVYENATVQKGLSPSAVSWAFTHPQVGNWIPLTTLSHMLDCQIFHLHAGGHHFVNVLLHAAAAAILFLALRELTGSLWRSAFVAAFFAVHPLRAESVAWVSERKDVLSGFFFMAALWTYARNARRPSRFGNSAVALLFALGLMAKSMVATLPCVLLLLDYWPLRRFANWPEFFGRLREKGFLFALGAAACAANLMVPGLVLAHRTPFSERLSNALVSWVIYMRQTAFPSGLHTPYALEPHPAGVVCGAFLVLAAITIAAIRLRRGYPFLLTGWLWYLGMLFPVIGIVQISADAAHSDRYNYLPGIGLGIAATWALGSLAERWKFKRAMLGGAAAVILGALAVCGFIQTFWWRDSETLWKHTIALDPQNLVAHYCRAAALAKKGANKEAIAEYETALRIEPRDEPSWNNLANLLAAEGRRADAIALYRKALELRPDYADACNNLALALFQNGEIEAAVRQYQKLVELTPNDAVARGNFALALGRNGQHSEAIAQYRKALELDPDYGFARRNLGAELLRWADFAGAMKCYEKDFPANVDLCAKWNSLGNAFAKAGNFREAASCYGRAREINPRDAGACAGLGLALFGEGDIRNAIGAWKRALELQPNESSIQNNLAWLLATTAESALRDGREAVALAESAKELTKGENAAVLHTLAAAYAETGRYTDAAATARRALEVATAQSNSDLMSKLPDELKLYATGQPLRDPPQ